MIANTVMGPLDITNLNLQKNSDYRLAVVKKPRVSCENVNIGDRHLPPIHKIN